MNNDSVKDFDTYINGHLYNQVVFHCCTPPPLIYVRMHIRKYGSKFEQVSVGVVGRNNVTFTKTRSNVRPSHSVAKTRMAVGIV